MQTGLAGYLCRKQMIRVGLISAISYSKMRIKIITNVVLILTFGHCKMKWQHFICKTFNNLNTSIPLDKNIVLLKSLYIMRLQDFWCHEKYSLNMYIIK